MFWIPVHRAVLALLLATLAGAAPAGAAKPPPLGAGLGACEPGSALFSASMPAVDGTERMAMRFDLEVRKGTADWARLELPKWGVWQRSAAGVPGFIVGKSVAELTAPAAYRAVVRFRWYDADGRVLRRTLRVTKACTQVDRRADLAIGSLTLAADGRYLVAVRNDGLGDAGPFSLRLSVGDVASEVVVDGLAAGAQRTVAVKAPACRPGSTVSIVIDATDAVDDAHEENDLAARPCPAATPV